MDQLLPLLLVSFASRGQHDSPVMPVPRLPAPRVGGGRYRVLCGSNVYRHCTKKTCLWFSVMCLTHFDLKIFKAALFFLKICHADPHDCVQYFPSSSLPKNPPQKARHAYFCGADRLTLADMNLIRYPTWSCNVQSYWSPKTPMKSSGQCMCLPKRQERYHEIYHEMKIDGKWTESGLGCLCFFSLF